MIPEQSLGYDLYATRSVNIATCGILTTDVWRIKTVIQLLIINYQLSIINYWIFA